MQTISTSFSCSLRDFLFFARSRRLSANRGALPVHVRGGRQAKGGRACPATWVGDDGVTKRGARRPRPGKVSDRGSAAVRKKKKYYKEILCHCAQSKRAFVNNSCCGPRCRHPPHRHRPPTQPRAATTRVEQQVLLPCPSRSARSLPWRMSSSAARTAGIPDCEPKTVLKREWFLLKCAPILRAQAPIASTHVLTNGILPEDCTLKKCLTK